MHLKSFHSEQKRKHDSRKSNNKFYNQSTHNYHYITSCADISTYDELGVGRLSVFNVRSDDRDDIWQETVQQVCLMTADGSETLTQR